MQTPEEIARDIVAREGGFVNDPDDPGGATNHGVTIHTMRRLRLDLDGDGDVDVADVKRMTPQRAERIFLEHYYHRPQISKLPEVLRASVFDMYVNAGANAVRILQRLLTKMGRACVADGVIGPKTLAAAEAVCRRHPHLVADAYGIARRNYYYSVGDKRPRLRKYARRDNGGKGGWITRAEEFISPRHHLTDKQHRERTAAWH